MSWRRIAPLAAGVLAALWAISWTHGFGLFGFDSYPILLTSRVENVSDFFGSFTEELMDGRFEGHFYRPVLNLSFALDAAIWHLNPFGYQLTNAVLFGGCVAMCFVLARQLLGAAAWIGPSVAGLVFCLHPSQVEALPVPSRRPELMAWLFAAAALAAQLGSPPRLRRWLPACLGLVAMLSKETAFILPAWIFVAVFLSQRNVRRAINATLPQLAALAVALLARLAVLHGAGGYADTSLSRSLARAPAAFVAAFKMLIMAQPPLKAGLGGVPALVLCCFAVALAGGLLLRSSRNKTEQNTVLVGAFWCAAVALSTSLAGRVATWYVCLMVGGWALLLGGFSEAGWRAVRSKSIPTRRIGVLVLAFVLVLVLWPARYSPLIYRYEEWPAAAAASRSFLIELDRQLGSAAEGSVIPSPPIPRWAKVRPDVVAVRGAALFSGMTLEAYFELAYPGRQVRLVRPGEHQADPNAILVVPTAFVPGFDGP